MRLRFLILFACLLSFTDARMIRGFAGFGKGGAVPASGGGGGTAFVTGQTLVTTRNDFSAYVGMKFTVGASNITVTDLGRWVISGNSQTHTISLYSNPASSPPTLLGSVSLNTSGLSAGYNYVTLGSPIVLTAGQTYVIASQEFNGGDLWYDLVTVTTTAAASVNNGAYEVNPTFNAFADFGTSNQCYVPLSFKY